MMKQPEKYLKFTIYLVAVILINLAGITLFQRFDLTGQKIYSISDASRKAVSTLSEPLTINVFFTQDLPAPYNATERYLRDLLEEYSIRANMNFNYKFFNTSPGDDAGDGADTGRKLAESYGIRPVQIRINEKDEIKFKQAYMGLVMIHGDIIEKIPAILGTDGLEYKITTGIMKMNNKISALLNLKEKVSVKLYLSSSLSRVAGPLMGIKNMGRLPEKLKEAISEINDKNYGKLTFEALDPEKDPALYRKASKMGMVTLSWKDFPKAGVSAGKGAIGMTMDYEGKSRYIPLLDIIDLPIVGTQYQLVSFDDLSEMINENLETLIDINESVGFLAGHGEPPLFDPSMMNPAMRRNNQPGITNFNALASKSYSLNEIDTKTRKIPESLKTLIIAGPTEKLTDHELFQIDQALMRGTNLAIFADPFKEVQQQNQQFGFSQGPRMEPVKSGLEKLLSHYGIDLKNSYVMDENCYRQQLPREYGGGENPVYFAPVIQNRNINKSLAFMKNIRGLITMKNAPVILDEKKAEKNKIKAEKLFSSSERSWEMSGNISLNPMMQRPPASSKDMRSIPLAYILSGEFKSYFEGKPVPEKQVPGEEKAGEVENKAASPAGTIETGQRVITRGKPAKIFVMGTSDVLRDNMLDESGASPNATFVMNVIDTLNGRDDIAEMRSKQQSFNPLDPTKPVTKNLIRGFNIAGLPVMVVISGSIIFAGRRSRKALIRKSFSKQEKI